MHETAYTYTSFGSFVASASQDMEISNTCMSSCVRNGTLDQTVEATFGVVVTYTFDETGSVRSLIC